MQIEKPVVIDHAEFVSILESGSWKGFKGNILFGVKMEGADLTGIDLSDCVLFDCSFTACNLHKANLSGLHTGNSGVLFIGCDLQGANLAKADLSTLSFIGCKLMGCDMTHADLSRSFIIGSYLITCNLRGVNMVDADLTGTVLQNNDMYNTVGNGVQLKSILCAAWPITYTSTELQFASVRVDALRPVIRDAALKQTHGEIALSTWKKWAGLIGSVMIHEPAVAFPDSPFLPVRFKDTATAEALPGLRVSHDNGFVFVEPPEDEGDDE